MTPAIYPSPSPSLSQEQILAAWRERIFFAIFLSVILLGIIPLISSALLAIQEGRWTNLAVFTIGYLGIVLILVVKQIPFPLRVMIGMAVFYLIGVNNLVTLGLMGSGRIWLFAFSLIASLLLGLRAGLITLALNLATLVTLGYFLAKGDLAWASTVSMKIFLITSITLLFLNALITVSLAVLVKALEQELLQKHRLTQELTTTNEQLHQDRIKRRATEEALIQSEKKLSQAVQGNSIPTFIIDNTHLITHWNLAFENLTGFSEAEMKGTHQHWAAFYPEERPTLADFIVDQTPAPEIQRDYGEKIHPSNLIDGAFEGEHFFPHFGEKGKWLYCTSAPLKDIEGNLMGAIETVQDITEWKNTEAQLHQAQKMESVGRLAGGVAHDYNNALSVVIGFTELVMEEMDPHGRLHADLKEVLKAAGRATDITRQLLAFARKQTIAPRLLNLNPTVENMLKMLRRLIGEDIDLAWHPGARLGNIMMDPSQIDQILANLCVNAKDAIGGVGKVTIETGTDLFDDAYCSDHKGFFPGEFITLAVSDTGCGMDKETLQNIFEPFFTTKTVDKGTGLGLSMVYGIVKQNNGFINVYSEPGKGTTIKIYLPVHRADAVDLPRESTGEIPFGSHETLLVVEDDLSILKLTEKILLGLGYTLLAASSPTQALDMAKHHPGPIHLLVTDVIMPEMNGRELADQIKALYPDLKCMFMSGYTANAIAHHSVLDPGVHFIQKPFSKKDLAKTVRKALDE